MTIHMDAVAALRHAETHSAVPSHEATELDRTDDTTRCERDEPHHHDNTEYDRLLP